MKFRLCLILVFTLLLPCVVLSQPADTGYRKQIEQFFSLMKDGKYPESVDYIYSGSPWMKSKGDEIAKVRNAFQGMTTMIGGFIGDELVVEEHLGQKLVHLNYVVYFERQPLRFYFQFYKPKDAWMTYAFGFKDDMDDWLAEKAKTKYTSRSQ